MLEFFMEGGWGMFPVLAIGLVMVGAGFSHAASPSAGKLDLVVALGVTLTIAMVHATWSDLAAVFNFLQDSERAPDGQLVRILFTGLKECTRPGMMGGAFMTLAAIAASLGQWRRLRGAGAPAA